MMDDDYDDRAWDGADIGDDDVNRLTFNLLLNNLSDIIFL